MRCRNGILVAAKMDKVNSANIQIMIDNHIDNNATLCTDEATIYKGIEGYKQLMVNHSAGQYVDGTAHTNGIESVWALLKRGYNGVFHHFSDKHIGRYVDEFVFRLNDGNVKRSTLDRIDSIVFGFSGCQVSPRYSLLSKTTLRNISGFLINKSGFKLYQYLKRPCKPDCVNPHIL